MGANGDGTAFNLKQIIRIVDEIGETVNTSLGIEPVLQVLLTILSLVLLAHFSGAPPGSTYVPAHIEDGRLVPGRSQ